MRYNEFYLYIALLVHGPNVMAITPPICRKVLEYSINDSRQGYIENCGLKPNSKGTQKLRLKIGRQPIHSRNVSEAQFKKYSDAISRLGTKLKSSSQKDCESTGHIAARISGTGELIKRCVADQALSVRQAEDLILNAYMRL